MLSLGLMSGTSMDGIDAALLETDGTATLLRDLGHSSISYTREFKILLKAAEYAVRSEKGKLALADEHFEKHLQGYLREALDLREKLLSPKIAELTRYLYGRASKTPPALSTIIQHSTQLHAQAVKQLLQKTAYDNKKIAVVGYHGQTVFHRPEAKMSVSLGDGQMLANELDITVVSDFRSQDLLAGGQGAPFAPLYHQALALRDKKIPAAIVNCGGIANITLITNDQEADLLAFDTGPGNVLIDRLVKQRSGGKENMDENGRYGKKGIVNARVLEALYEQALNNQGQNYLLKAPPKALDSGDLKLIPELAELSLEDACATLEAFTAETIVRSLLLIQVPFPPLWILTGGGWNNPVIRFHLEKKIKEQAGEHIKIKQADEIGWNSQAMEAQIFAYLAVRSLQKQPLSLPKTTGVARAMTGGQHYFPV
ncbi:MAG TPA: anhydro-N-acetylmuramic acid kinase [Gammaproteobacteria bacterium]|nr:anhydro-N-acetylmuramic acid kinase [Gammaproteobacteria bacterium]